MTACAESEEQPKTRNKWTSAEITELRRVFATCLPKELALLFPRHSPASIKALAFDLGLKRPTYGHRKWATVIRNHAPVFGFARVVYD